MLILGLLGIYFDAAVVPIKKTPLLSRLALAKLWKNVKFLPKGWQNFVLILDLGCSKYYQWKKLKKSFCADVCFQSYATFIPFKISTYIYLKKTEKDTLLLSCSLIHNWMPILEIAAPFILRFCNLIWLIKRKDSFLHGAQKNNRKAPSS